MSTDDTKTKLQAIFDESRNGCNRYIRHGLTPRLIYTDGVEEVVDLAAGYWLLDIIGTEVTPKLLNHYDAGGSSLGEFIIEVDDQYAAVLSLVMGDDQPPIWTRDIPFTTFPHGKWTLLLSADSTLFDGRIGTVLILLSEY